MGITSFLKPSWAQPNAVWTEFEHQSHVFLVGEKKAVRLACCCFWEKKKKRSESTKKSTHTFPTFHLAHPLAMTTPLCQLNRKLATTTTPGTGIMNRLAGLSLRNGTTIPSTFRGYARAARARPSTPKAPSSSSKPAQEAGTEPLKPAPVVKAASTKSETPSNIKLPSNFKLAKLEPVQEYDPNMIIFLDKHGKVTMIPHDSRVTGQTKEERDSMDLLGDSAVEESTHQRGSKEMDYGRKRIGQVEMPKPLQDAIRSVLDGNGD